MYCKNFHFPPKSGCACDVSKNSARNTSIFKNAFSQEWKIVEIWDFHQKESHDKNYKMWKFDFWVRLPLNYYYGEKVSYTSQLFVQQRFERHCAVLRQVNSNSPFAHCHHYVTFFGFLPWRQNLMGVEKSREAWTQWFCIEGARRTLLFLLLSPQYFRKFLFSALGLDWHVAKQCLNGQVQPPC